MTSLSSLLASTGCGLGTTKMPADFPAERSEYKGVRLDSEIEDGGEGQYGPYHVAIRFESEASTIEVEYQPSGETARFSCEQEKIDTRDKDSGEATVEATMTCNGSDSQGGEWSVEIEQINLHDIDSLTDRYRGKISGPEQFEITAFGEESRGGAPGYQLRRDGQLEFAVRPPNFAGASEIWVAHQEQKSVGSVAAALSLFLFVPPQINWGSNSSLRQH